MADNLQLEVRIRHRLGTLELDIDFATNAAWTILFGSSGSGKSTVLRAIAGVLRPDSGRIVLGDTVVFDSTQGIFIPSHQRRMRWAPQRAMLFPGMDLKANLASGIRGDSQSGKLQAVLRHFGLVECANRLPEELSGGQLQRIGVIRAAAGLHGGHLLLDEPFTGLDAAVRDRLIAELRTWRGGAPTLSVTHDVGEAFLLGAEVVRIGAGRVIAQGPVETVLADERDDLLHMLG
jgi:molybdate transport system ATP-binding protein